MKNAKSDKLLTPDSKTNSRSIRKILLAVIKINTSDGTVDILKEFSYTARGEKAAAASADVPVIVARASQHRGHIVHHHHLFFLINKS